MPSMSRLALFFAVLLLFAISGVQAQILDDFTESQGPAVDAVTDGTPVTDVGAFGPLGMRTLSADKTGGPDGNAARLEVIGAPGVLSYSQDAGVTGVGIVTWAGGPADLTAGGADSLQLIIDENQEAVPIVVRVGDGVTTAAFSTMVPEIPPAANTLTISLDEFAGVDHTAVTLLELEIQGTGDGDDILLESLGLVDNIPPDVDISKSVEILINDDDCLGPGDVLQYTVVVTNTGDGALAQVDVTDPLPAEVALTGAATGPGGVTFTSGGVVGDTAVDFSVADLAEGASATVTFQVTINGGLVLPGTIVNTATVTAATGVTTLPAPATATLVVVDCSVVVSIPTLSQWSMLLLGAVLVVMGWIAHRRGMIA